MKRIFDFDFKGQFQLDIESKLFNKIRNKKTWFSNPIFSFFVLIIAGVSDISGFYDVLSTNINQNDWLVSIIVASLSIAFEIAPLYIGYAICLKAYNLGKKIRKSVLIFSSMSFILGVLANIIYRFMLMLTGEGDVDLALTILMCILPVITSTMNLAIGCLSFDPLTSDVLRLTKIVNRIKSDIITIESILVELDENSEKDEKTALIEVENRNYNLSKKNILTSNIRNKDYGNAKFSDIKLERGE